MSGQKPARVGVPEINTIAIPIAAGAAKIFAGNDVALNSSGTGQLASVAGSLYVIGKASKDIDQSAATTASYLDCECGAYFYANGSGINALGAGDCYGPVYVDSTGKASKTDQGGACVYLGYMLPAGGSTNLGTGPDSGKVLVRVGQSSGLSAVLSSSRPGEARFVATSLAAFAQASGVITASANGAMGSTQDGITPALGDVMFLALGTCGAATVAAADAGPWVITSLGSASTKYTLARPFWYRHGGLVPQGFDVKITNGTLFGGSTFRSFATTATKVIGTDDPVFWPGSVRKAVTLASGTLGAAITSIPVRSLSYTTFEISSDPTTAPHANTRVWRASAVTVGPVGTASIQIVAESAPGTTNASDVGQYVLKVSNWS